MKKTLVLGASSNPERYANQAVKRLRLHGHQVIAVGNREGQIADVPVSRVWPEKDTVNTLTLYLNPGNQVAYYDRIIALHPERIIFNPGTENEELQTLANKHGIETVEACTLVLLSTGQY